jgi:hypothetical protein
VTFTPAISPVCLPETSEQYAYKDAAIVGWGTVKEGKWREFQKMQVKRGNNSTRSLGGSLPTVLKQSTVKVLANSKCKQSYPTITGNQLCAAAPGTDTCQVLNTIVIGLGHDLIVGFVSRVTVVVPYSCDRWGVLGPKLESLAMELVRKFRF